MNPHFHTDFSISDSLIFVRKSVLIYETIIHRAWELEYQRKQEMRRNQPARSKKRSHDMEL